MKKQNKKSLVIYQSKSGAIEFHADYSQETIWANINEISELFGINKSNVSRHINNVFKDKEIIKDSTVAKYATVQRREGKRNITRRVEYFSLDIILAVGYRARSAKRAIEFRKWATKTLRQHILEGYTINRKRVSQNYDAFMKAVADVKALLPEGNQVQAKDILELIHAFAGTWFSLEAYDNQKFPKEGATKKEVVFTSDELDEALHNLKQELIGKKQATPIFGCETRKKAVAGIIGNIFQSFDKRDLYSTVEEKAAHLLYFIVKDHPYTDGNKRSGAFAFIWFLRRAGILPVGLTPEALTALTLLVAESHPRDKEKMIGVILLILRKT